MLSNTISEERVVEVVVSPNNYVYQIGRLIKPMISIDASPPNRSPLPTSVLSSHPNHLEKVEYVGWVNPQQKWIDWVNNMKSLHSLAWKTAGIHDAIMNSTLNIPKNRSLILWFAEKWSSKTNTFILPWGEITITLEDMMILGGFSVWGDPVTCQVESNEDCHALFKLKKAYMKLIRTPSKKASFNAWLTKFMGKEKACEHEAFIVLWLSKYILPSVKNTIQPQTFQLAIFLARGRRFAMAPAVLATLYRDLHILQTNIINLQTQTILQQVFAPMYYIQVWAWERFPYLRPQGMRNSNSDDETRLARWSNLDNIGTNYITLELGTREEQFKWRPYLSNTNHFNENWSVDTVNKEEVYTFARCVRVCNLVGLDICQPYFPHRVSKQFGYDQDIPADVLQLEDIEDAWVDYSTPLWNEKIHLPSREFGGFVTKRYEKWWESGPVAPAGSGIPVPPKRQRRRKITAK